jgi:dTDP-4-dehydrorhamnose reductase
MRAYVTGASGFVGSNIARVLGERHGAQLCTPVHRVRPSGALADAPVVDLADAAAVRASVLAFRPDVIVHSAILNDFDAIYADRRAGWTAYVEATEHVVDAANEVGARVVLVSTDWVFDGTQGGADETTPPNPVNLYGVLKLASELVVLERARHGSVARISGVNGVHWARHEMPVAQNAGFGYFVDTVRLTLGAGRPFTVWEGARINMVATPTLASDAAERIWAIADRGLDGVFHCCGAEATGRLDLALATAAAWSLDPSLIRTGPPDGEQLGGAPVPYDSSLSCAGTAAALEMPPLPVAEQLRRMRLQLETGELV